MKYLAFLCSLIALPLMAQNEDNPENPFDFWVGKWEVSWDEPGGKKGKGINNIIKILDDSVIEENFEIHEGQNAGFKGKSLTVYNPQNQIWKQAWADNQGGYFDFTGIIEENRRIFQTSAQTLPNGNSRIQRMVFYDITQDSFTWDWEASADNGESWNLLWRIQYHKTN